MDIKSGVLVLAPAFHPAAPRLRSPIQSSPLCYRRRISTNVLVTAHQLPFTTPGACATLHPSCDLLWTDGQATAYRISMPPRLMLCLSHRRRIVP